MFQLVPVAPCPFPEQRFFSLVSLGAAGDLLLLPGGFRHCQCLTHRCLQKAQIPSSCRCVHMCMLTNTVSVFFIIVPEGPGAPASQLDPVLLLTAYSVVPGSLSSSPCSPPHLICFKDTVGDHVTGFVKSK